MKTRQLILGIVATVLLIPMPLAFGDYPSGILVKEPSSLLHVTQETGHTDIFLAALEDAGLSQVFDQIGPFTVFVPRDAAFSQLKTEDKDVLLSRSGRDSLTQVLTYHVVPGIILFNELAGLEGIKTVHGNQMSVQYRNGIVTVDNAKVVTADIRAANGVVHIVDAVMKP